MATSSAAAPRATPGCGGEAQRSAEYSNRDAARYRLRSVNRAAVAKGITSSPIESTIFQIGALQMMTYAAFDPTLIAR